MYGGESPRVSSSGARRRSERGSCGGGEDEANSSGSRQAVALQDNKPRRAAHDASGTSDFSVHRLLPPPSVAFAPQPPELEPAQVSLIPPTTNNSPTPGEHSTGASSSECHLLSREGNEFQLEPLGSTQWVGYGSVYQQESSLPTYNNRHLPLPGPGHQRWTNVVYPPYPVPPSYANTPSSPFPPNTPGTPSHPHHHNHESTTVTSPVDPSPRPVNGNGTNMHLYHPANAGLYTLCQAAMMSSSLQDNSYQNYPPNQQPPQMNLSLSQSRPPPPYIQYYQESSPFSLSQSPHHPPTVYHSMQVTPAPQHTMICGSADTTNRHTTTSPSFLNRVSTNGIIQTGEQRQHSPSIPFPLLPPRDLVQSGRFNQLTEPGNFTTHQQLPSGNGGVGGVGEENSDQKPIIHPDPLSLPNLQDPSSSSSPFVRHFPPSMVQDREQRAGVNNGAISLHSLPIEGQQHPPDRPLQFPEGNQSSIQNLAPVGKGGKQSRTPPRTLSYREEQPNLPLVLNRGKSSVEDAEETGTYIEDGEDDAGTSFVQNAEEPESPHHNSFPGGNSDDGIVATLATANAVIDDGGERVEEGEGNNVPAPESLPNHSPSSIQSNNASFQLPPGLPPPLPPPTSSPHLQTNSIRSKRTRTAYSQAQQDALELAFHANPYPDGFFRQKVSRQVGIPEDRIQVWFQNRRARGKKQSRTGSVSRRSIIRDQRLKSNLASIARQTALMTAAARRFGAPQPQSPLQSQQQFTQHQKSLEVPSQPLELPGQPQQQLELPGQAQQQLELPHGQLEEHGSHPQQIQQLQLQGMEQSHLDQQQLQVQTESQQMLEQQQTELQQESGENNEVPTSPTITSSGSIEISQLQISSPFTRPPATTDLPTTAGSVATESPSFPAHSDSANTLSSQEIPHMVFSSNSSTICYFPQPTPQQSLSPNPSTHHHLMSGANSATALNVPQPQSQSHSATYFSPPSLANSQHPLPSFQHLYSPNPSFQFPHPSAPSNSLRSLFPSPFYHYQPRQPYHHMGLVGGRTGSSMSSPGESISPVLGAGDRSHSAPSSVSLPVSDAGT